MLKNRMRYTFHNKHGKAGLALLYLIFKTRSIKRDNASHFIITKSQFLGRTYKNHKDVCTHNRFFTYMKKNNLTELEVEIHKSTSWLEILTLLSQSQSMTKQIDKHQ